MLVAADAKLNFDDNAAFRQKEIFAMRDTSQEDPREVSYFNFFPGLPFLDLLNWQFEYILNNTILFIQLISNL